VLRGSYSLVCVSQCAFTSTTNQAFGASISISPDTVILPRGGSAGVGRHVDAHFDLNAVRALDMCSGASSNEAFAASVPVEMVGLSICPSMGLNFLDVGEALLVALIISGCFRAPAGSGF